MEKKVIITSTTTSKHSVGDVLLGLTQEQQKILSLFHIEVCGVCGREVLHIDVLGAEKRCMNCLGRFRNKRAEK